MRLTSCWSARMTEPLQMAAKITRRAFAVWHVGRWGGAPSVDSALAFFPFWYLVLCSATHEFGEYWCACVCTCVHQYSKGEVALPNVESQGCTQSILNETLLDYHRALQQLVQCGLIMLWMLDGFWLILIIHRHSDSTWLWHEAPSAPR